MSRTAIAFTFVVGLLVVASGRWSGTAVWMSATFAEDAPARVTPPVTPKPVLFETHVRSILKAHCWQCHGDEEKPEGKLDLRLVRLMSAGGESGPAISPGQPDTSLIWKAFPVSTSCTAASTPSSRSRMI